MSGMRTPGPAPRTGPRNALTDVAGIRVGHSARTGGGWLTGVTAVLAPEDGVAAAVDVRGGGPGTRETDALDPRNLVARIDAVVLTGGSAFGLDAASGVAAWLEERGRGFRVGAARPRWCPSSLPQPCSTWGAEVSGQPGQGRNSGGRPSRRHSAVKRAGQSSRAAREPARARWPVA